jgi:hypothetical protein
MRSCLGRALLAAAVLLVAQTAAASSEQDAAAAYDVGATAYDHGEYAKAAREFARADALAPNDVALELALHAVVHTSDAVLAMTLAERASSRATTTGLVTAGAAARKKFEDAVGKVVIRCPAGIACTPTLDDTPLEPGTPTLAAVGTHRVAIHSGERTENLEITLESRRTLEIVATAPPAPPAPEPAIVTVTAPAPAPSGIAPTPSGIAPTWFFVGVGVTALVGGASIASGVDTANKHEAFAADRSNTQLASDGRFADQRTTALVVATGGVAVVTGIVGLLLVRWGADSRVSLSSSGGAVTF